MMKCIITPSLERIAVIKIVSCLWNQSDIKALIASYNFQRDNFGIDANWQVIEEKVLEKISHLQQPKCLKEKLCGVVKSMGLEILKWKENYYYENGYICYQPSEIFFTQLGTIDNQKTVELLIKDETLSAERRYRLACMYCLEDYLPDLWNILSEYLKCKFYIQNRPDQIRKHLFVVFFTYVLKGELATFQSMCSDPQSLYKYLFEQAVRDGNIVAVEYFLKKLSPNDSKLSLIKAAARIANDVMFPPYIVDVLCFLLFQMNKEEQMQVFRNESYIFLECMLLRMLDWPWQGFFIEIITLMHSFVSQSLYVRLLRKIVYKVIDGYRDCYYRDLFIETCMQIPVKKRLCIVHEACASTSLLTDLFNIKDKENMKTIFQDSTPMLKKEFLRSEGIEIFRKLIYAGEWNLLGVFIQDCIATKKELADFMGNPDASLQHFLYYKNVWFKYYFLFASLLPKYDKRKSEEEISNTSVKRKKTCSINSKHNG